MKHNKTPEKKSKFFKFLFLALGAIIILFLLAGTYFFMPYLTSTPAAILSITKGSVELNQGNEWVLAQNNTKLKEGWSIRTGENTEASITFFGSATARFEPKAEMNIQSLDENTRRAGIKQVDGDIWYDVLEGSGIHFTIETQDGNFTNEGTSFGCSVTTPSPLLISLPTLKKATTITITKGTVSKKSDSTITMQKGTQTTFTPNVIISTPLEKTTWVTKNEQKSEDFVVQRREELKKKYARNIKLAKTAYLKLQKEELGDTLINTFIDQALTKEIDVSALISEGKIPKKYSYLVPKELIYVRPLTENKKTVETKSAGDKKPEIFIPIPKDVVVDLSECHEGQTKEEVVEASRKTTELRGIEWVRIKDWKGYRGLSASEQRAIIENTETGLKVIDYIGKASDLFDLGVAGLTRELAQTIAGKIPPFGYDQGFADPAKDAIMNKLKEWQESGALAGLPEWIEVEYGPVWSQFITKITYERKVYECVNKKWKYAYKDKLTKPDEYKKSQCFELTFSAGTYRYSPNLEDIPLEQCTAGKCLNAWAGEFPKALSAAMNKFKASAVGKCVP